MSNQEFKPLKITDTFYRIGTPTFPSYLSCGDDIMMIEGGTGATASIMVKQIEELGLDPQRIKYVALTHTHPDHIGALPHLKLLWPHLKIVGCPMAAKILRSEDMIKPFLYSDKSIAEIMKAKGEIDELPPQLDSYTFDVDWEVEEGDTIDLGNGIEWTVYMAPGHAPCHIALFEQKEKMLVVGDTTGFYVPEKDVFWPNYFHSLEKYCATIKKLATLPAERAVLSHNFVVEHGVQEFLQKALKATEKYHSEMMTRMEAGEDIKQVSKDTATWVNSITDIQPFEAMLGLCTLLIKRSQKDADKPDLF